MKRGSCKGRGAVAGADAVPRHKRMGNRNTPARSEFAGWARGCDNDRPFRNEPRPVKLLPQGALAESK